MSGVHCQTSTAITAMKARSGTLSQTQSTRDTVKNESIWFAGPLLWNSMKNIYPATAGTTIIGVSTIGGAFTQKVIETMSRINDRPVILALSNPTEHAECTAEQAYTWSKGKAIYAAGVQFAPVHYNGRTLLPGQANNFYIFPAVGMAIFATQAKRVTDEMFIEAGQAVADQVAPELLKQGLLYPLQANILETEIQTAARVAKLVFDSGLARVERPADMVAFIRRHVYKPEYGAVAAAAKAA